MLKGKPAIKSKTAPRSSDKLRKEALAVTDANLAKIEAKERGGKSKASTERDTTSLAEFFPRTGGSKKSKTAEVTKTKPAKAPKEKRMSGLDAAAKVLVESKEPLNSVDLIKAMETKGYWKSPGGKTPHATLHAAISREIKEKGKDSRFKKVDRGMFAATASAK